MSPEKQRITIAEACGWTIAPWGTPIKKDHKTWRSLQDLPDYLNDLNACHEMEEVLNIGQKLQYVEILRSTHGPVFRDRLPVTWIYAHLATAPQRCEAFLRTLGKWEGAQ